MSTGNAGASSWKSDLMLALPAMLVALAANAGICFAGGFLFCSYAVLRWAHLGFGPLNDSEIPRIVVLGLSLIVISFQAFFSAFLLGVLEIPVKRLKAGQPNELPAREDQ